MAAAAALTCGVSAYAANPFSDVTPSDWAYQAVTSLSEQGVVEGYPDGTFKGQQNITRYEMAQIIARMLAKEDQYNAEQRATIDKLASEYADELNNLGVRVSNLEKKVGNIRFNGDARMRYNQSYGGTNGTDAKDSWNGRVRIGATATVNDNTYVYGRLRSDMDFVNEKNTKTNNWDSDTYMDRLFVHHQFGSAAGVTLGRSELYMGTTGIFYDDIFDGIRANLGTQKLNVEAGYGRFRTWNLSTSPDFFKNDTPDAWYASVKGMIGKATIGADYLQVSSKVSTANVVTKAQTGDDYKFWGANLNVPVDQFAVFGDYYKNTGMNGDPQFYTAGLSYGVLNKAKAGSFKISGQYVKAEAGSYLGGTTLNIDPTAVSYATGNKDVKYWLAMADIMLMKNVDLNVQYAFNVKAGTTAGDKDYDDLAAVALNYSF